MNYFRGLWLFFILLRVMVSYAEEKEKSVSSSLDASHSVLKKASISANFIEKKELESIQSISMIDQFEIESDQADQATELITHLPGIDVYGGSNHQGSEFNIRGFNRPERNIVRVDGVTSFFEQYRLGSFFLDPELFRQVDVIRGPISTVYGNGAIGGIVDIRLKTASDFLKKGQKYGFQLKSGYHTNNEALKGAAYLYARPYKDLDFLAALNIRKSKDHHFADGSRFLGSGMEIKNAVLKAEYHFLESHSLSVSYRYSDDDNLVEYRQNDRGNSGLGNGFSEGLVRRHMKDSVFSAGYSYQPEFNPYIDFNLKFALSEIENHETGLDFVLYPNAALSLPKDQTRLARYKTWQFGFMNTSKFLVLDHFKHVLTLGFDAQHQDREGLEYSSVFKRVGPSPAHAAGTQTVYGGFIQDEITLYHRLILIPALRYTRYKTKGDRTGWEMLPASYFAPAKKYSAFLPALSIEFKAMDWISLIGGYYHGFRAPAIDEIYSHSIFHQNKTTSLSLKEEKSRTQEIGIKTNFKNIFHPKDQLKLKLVYFKNKLDDKIESRRSDPSNSLSYVNAGNRKVKGWELESAYYTEFAYLKLTAARLRGREIFQGSRIHLDTIPADKIGLKFGGKLKQWGIDLGMSSLLSFEIPAKRRPEICTHAGCQQPLDVPSYLTHNAYLIWRPKQIQGLKLHFSVHNLLDEDYKRHNSSVRSFGRDFRFLISYQY